MDPVRFDRLAKFAARRPSRRALLGALGGVLIALGGGGVPVVAAEDSCDPAFRHCQDTAHAALVAAEQACRAGAREAEAPCLAQAHITFLTATTACTVALGRCRGLPEVCVPAYGHCSHNVECCSQHCLKGRFQGHRCK